MNLENTIKEIADESLDVFKEIFNDSIEDVEEEINSFINQAKKDAQNWGLLLLAGKLSKGELLALIEDQKDEIQSRLLRIAGEKQIETSRAKDRLINIIIDKLSELSN